MSEITIQGISKTFGDTRVLNDISFCAKDGNLLSLLGPSGCGKTTLLRIIAGLEYADSGTIHVGERDLTPIPVEKRNIGVVFQNYALIPHMTVFNNIAYGLKIRKVPKEQIREKVEQYIRLVGLTGMTDRKVTQLSGGQQQRVALARALIIEPDILLLDEPLSALDRKIRAEMQYEIRRIQQQVGITTIFVTHDQEEAMTMSDEILLMRNGGIEQLSTPENIYNHPVSLYASDFLGKANTLIGTLHQAPDGWTVFGDGWEFPVEPQNGFADGEEVCLANRPAFSTPRRTVRRRRRSPISCLPAKSAALPPARAGRRFLLRASTCRRSTTAPVRRSTFSPTDPKRITSKNNFAGGYVL